MNTVYYSIVLPPLVKPFQKFPGVEKQLEAARRLNSIHPLPPDVLAWLSRGAGTDVQFIERAVGETWSLDII